MNEPKIQIPNDNVRAYFGTFHRVYREKVQVAIPEQYRAELQRYPYLSNSVVAYISSTWGRGYEYHSNVGGPTQQVDIGVSSEKRTKLYANGTSGR